ncbi:MAG: 13E12 repeat family protein, partial [Yaniella sp.]|nr:13E12 repeat family protein [Yaniella sp.]
MTDSMTGAASMVQVRAMLGMLDPSDSSAQCIDRLQTLARLKARIAALEAEEIADLEQYRHEEEAARGVPKSRRGHGLAAEIGLARGQSPARGSKCLQVARTLVQDMPKTLDALALGQLDEERAQAVVKEVSWLTPEHRTAVDALIAGQFEGLGPRKLAGKVRAHAERLDQHGALERN